MSRVRFSLRTVLLVVTFVAAELAAIVGSYSAGARSMVRDLRGEGRMPRECDVSPMPPSGIQEVDEHVIEGGAP